MKRLFEQVRAHWFQRLCAIALVTGVGSPALVVARAIDAGVESQRGAHEGKAEQCRCLCGKAARSPRAAVPEWAYRGFVVETDSKVVVEVRTDENGEVVSARSISGPPELGPDAERAARRRTYEQRRLNGVPVGVIQTVTFTYTRGTVIAPFERTAAASRD